MYNPVKALLPDLDTYKERFLKKGLTLPLKEVPFSSDGLLNYLPKPRSLATGWPWNLETDPKIYDLNQQWPKITIVTPSFNQGEYLEENIRSVLLQNYPNLEYIIMDGGSNDETKTILEKYSPWLSHWQSDQDDGQGQAINMGFSLASGAYYGWLNSDDYYHQHALYHLGKEILKSKKDFYYGDGLTIYAYNTNVEYWKANFVSKRYLHFGGLIASHSAFWNKNIHEPIWEQMNCNVDGELWFRLIPGRSKKHISFPLGVFRVQMESKTSHKRWKEKWKEDSKNIHLVHGLPHKVRSWLFYEYRYVQRLYKFLNRGKK